MGLGGSDSKVDPNPNRKPKVAQEASGRLAMDFPAEPTDAAAHGPAPDAAAIAECLGLAGAAKASVAALRVVCFREAINRPYAQKEEGN